MTRTLDATRPTIAPSAPPARPHAQPGPPPRSVGDLDLAELRRLDVGAWYGRDHAGERMPTLDEFLTALARRDTARALVELKADWDPAAVRTMVDLVERHGLRGRVVLQSFSLETLFAVQKVSPTTR